MPKTFAFVAHAVRLIALSGCATSPADLRRAGPDRVGSFVVLQGYASTYVVTGRSIVQGEPHPDTRSGAIAAATQGLAGIDIHTLLDVRAVDERAHVVFG